MPKSKSLAGAGLMTKDVARLLQVSEATVKRWADDGLLRPNKTAGGHRRFNIETVARFKREREGLSAPPEPKRHHRATPLVSVERFTELLLEGDAVEVEAALINAYLDGHELPAVFDTLVTKSMHRVGDMWFNGTASVADEHLASRVLLRALQKLRPIILRKEPVGKTVICCGLEGDLHEVPVHLAEIVIEAEGWQTRNLGPNTPLFALSNMLLQYKPNLVCLSARAVADLDRATSDFALLRKATDKLGAKVITGGEAFRDRTMRERFPADFYAMHFSSLAKFVSSLAQL
ncbi:MAG TPA: B12-binding domain-containing protein [Pyrinomonadaceae bacterium]|nr:B12-binding domain-containing protein [Pyrinomonadaceae bacterium]